MSRSHGPALVRSLIPLTDCPSCAGNGLIKGVFYDLDCIGCHSSGYVHAQTLEVVPLEQLVVQLGRMARRGGAQITGKNPTRLIVDEYQTANNRGPGGSSYKGD